MSALISKTIDTPGLPSAPAHNRRDKDESSAIEKCEVEWSSRKLARSHHHPHNDCLSKDADTTTRSKDKRGDRTWVMSGSVQTCYFATPNTLVLGMLHYLTRGNREGHGVY